MEKPIGWFVFFILCLKQDWLNKLFFSLAMNELLEATEPLLESHKDDPSFVDIMMRLLEQKPGFKDSNIQVIGKVFELVGRLSQSPYFETRMADLVLEGTLFAFFCNNTLTHLQNLLPRSEISSCASRLSHA